MSLGFGFKYRDSPHTPYWGPVNSHANFCEEDYIITPYIAEFINTLTNLTYLYYAFHGIKNNSNRKDAVLRNIPYLGIAGVGLGSTIFHATLKYWTQWMDDLSMLIAVATVLHRIYTFDTTLQRTVISGLVLTTLMTLFSVWHCVTDELIGHQVIFGIMIVFVGLKTHHIIKARVENPDIRKEVAKLSVWGGAIFVTGFAIWNIDNLFCAHLGPAKRAIGMPWSFVLELHGWWHILTGIGAYIFIALVEYLASEQAGEPLGREFAWPVGLLVKCDAGANRSAGRGGKVDEEAEGESEDGVVVEDRDREGENGEDGEETPLVGNGRD